MKIRTRFAPSPTGHLHIGGLRTALYNFLFAKQNKGEFILRIEDTDQNRLIDSATENLCNILSRLNLDYDFGPGRDDQCGPYVQSLRLNIYKKYYMKLIQSQKAYICFVKNNELHPEYDVEKGLKKINNEPYIVKLKVKNNMVINIIDQIRGNIEFDLSLIEDPIIIKSDGYPTYHFANVVDDHLMKITHVIRGEEWISSLPKHITLYKAFGWDPPKFYHLPLLLNPDKSKLSKRQGDVAVEDFLHNGYLEDTLINFVALLGWHPKNNQEFFAIDELIHTFSIDRINKSGAIFDKEKLNWMNKEYIKQIDSPIFQNIIRQILAKKGLAESQIDIIKISTYTQSRINKINNIWDEIECFYIHNQSQKKELQNYDYKNLFLFWIKELEKNKTINEQNIKDIINHTQTSLNIKGGKLFIPMRIALIDKAHGPDLFTIINILSTKECISRLKKY